MNKMRNRLGVIKRRGNDTPYVIRRLRHAQTIALYDLRLQTAKEDIQRLERAVSVLTGSNPDWRMNVSKQDQEIIEEWVGSMWSESA